LEKTTGGLELQKRFMYDIYTEGTLKHLDKIIFGQQEFIISLFEEK
jgi:hypothetical protein